MTKRGLKKNNPFDGPGYKVGSKEFKEMVLGVMVNKHLDPDEDFDVTLYPMTITNEEVTQEEE